MNRDNYDNPLPVTLDTWKIGTILFPCITDAHLSISSLVIFSVNITEVLLITGLFMRF